MVLPKISIVTPSLNQGQFLEECIKSILDQGYENLEYIIIDGGSSDCSIDIIKKYKQFITYWVSEIDRGQSHAINKGFLRSTGDIVSWLNSDDLLAKGTLKKISNIFSEDNEIDMVYGDYYFVDNNGIPIKLWTQLKYSSTALWSGYNFITQPGSFYKRKIIDEVGFLDETLHYLMDFDLYLKLDLKKTRIKYIPEVLSYFRLHDGSKTSEFKNKFLEEKEFIFNTKYQGMKLVPYKYRKYLSYYYKLRQKLNPRNTN